MSAIHIFSVSFLFNFDIFLLSFVVVLYFLFFYYYLFYYFVFLLISTTFFFLFLSSPLSFQFSFPFSFYYHSLLILTFFLSLFLSCDAPQYYFNSSFSAILLVLSSFSILFVSSLTFVFGFFSLISLHFSFVESDNSLYLFIVRFASLFVWDNFFYYYLLHFYLYHFLKSIFPLTLSFISSRHLFSISSFQHFFPFSLPFSSLPTFFSSVCSFRFFNIVSLLFIHLSFFRNYLSIFLSLCIRVCVLLF